MRNSKPSAGKVRIRCFCGNSISVSKNARKAVVCNKCHQPLPMQAIKIAIRVREQEAMEKQGVVPGFVPSHTL